MMIIPNGHTGQDEPPYSDCDPREEHDKAKALTPVSKADQRAMEGMPIHGRSSNSMLWRNIVSALRVPQWSKNLLIFAPVLVTRSFDAQTVFDAATAFVAFCLAASATYVVNDLVDREADRNHHHKRYRVFASGQMSPPAGFALIAALGMAAALLATRLPWQFGVALLLYVAGSLAYSLVLKRVLAIDVVTIACLYVLRIVAGDEAIGAQFDGIDSSNWILGFCCLFFLSLALVKRCSDLSAIRAEVDGRMAGRSYRTEDFPVLMAFSAASAMASIAILMRYIDSKTVTESYRNPDTLWLVVPVIVFWLLRIILLANRGKIREDPVVFTFKDRKSQICTLAVALIAFAAV